MKPLNRFALPALVTIFVLLASACAPSASAPALSGSSKIQASTVEFTGVVTAINGNQWTIDGQTVTVDSNATSGTQFTVGSTVRVKGSVAPNGLVTASQVASMTSSSSDSNTNSGTTDNTNSSNDNSSGDSNSNGNDNGSQSGEDQKITGTVEAINGNQITIDGVVYTVADGVDLSGIAVGDTVTVEVVTNPDGTQTVTEVKSGDSVSDDNSNGDDGNSNDDNSNDNNSNDDNGSGGSGNGNGGGGGGNDNGGGGGNGNGG